jgi:hypothetical protein
MNDVNKYLQRLLVLPQLEEAEEALQQAVVPAQSRPPLENPKQRIGCSIAVRWAMIFSSPPAEGLN